MEDAASSSWYSMDRCGVEYIRWRKALRKQVEKELDYQVGLRLAASAQTIGRSLSSAHLIEPEVLPFTRRPSDQKKSDDALIGSTLESVDAPIGSTLESSPITRWIDHGQPASAVEGNFLHTARIRERRDDWGSKLPVLFSYITSKYGTPVEQLLHLSSSGCFKSVSVESSGHGDGSLIYFPPEANIILPTPSHIVNTSLTTLLPLKPEGTGSSLVPEICQGQWSDLEASRGKLKGEAGHGQLKGEAGHGQLKGEAGLGQLKGEARQCVGANSQTLHFESRFEGGNLQHAIEIGPQEYQLVLRPDLYSKRHMQWFYFRVSGMQAGIPYHFHIVNLQKPDSLYNHGMQPLLYSEKEAERGWNRVGYNISYSRNCSPSAMSGHAVMSGDKSFFTLSWTMEFPHSEDRCYLAHCFPYSFSKLLQFIKHLQLSPTIAPHVHCQEHCKTLAGNSCPLLTITDFQDVSNMSYRAGVLVSARVHPGETNSSWMMQGLIDWLTSDTPHAKVLRSHFVFKVIPMLNPDGVIVGNSRASLAGVDLNRTYKKPRRDLFPTVFHTKALLDSFMQERKVVLYMDLHGHSRKHNVFTYGCGSNKATMINSLMREFSPFCYLVSMFCLRSCKFSVERCKESTGRVVAWRMGLGNAFTLESTFCGSTLGQSWQFCERDLEGIGRGLGEAVYRYHRMLMSKRYKQKILGELADVLLKRCSLAREMELPDIVQSTVHQPKTKRYVNESRAKATTADSANKALREFMKYDLSLFEVESSTTGSDSENDEIEYLGTKKGKQRRKRKRQQMQRSTTLPSLQPLGNQPTSTLGLSSSQTNEATCTGHISSVAPNRQLPRAWRRQMRSKSSDESGKTDPQQQQINSKQQTWKFVNRYAHRSNGGIPIFSEERLHERAKKLQHQPQTSSSSHTSTDQSHITQLLWQPEDSSIMGVLAERGSGGMKDSRVGGASRGYMTISRLEKPPKAANSKASMCTTDSGAGRPRVPALGRRRTRLELLGEMQQLERTSLMHGGYTNTKILKLPTHLAKYISEIWKRSIQ